MPGRPPLFSETAGNENKLSWRAGDEQTILLEGEAVYPGVVAVGGADASTWLRGRGSDISNGLYIKSKQIKRLITLA